MAWLREQEPQSLEKAKWVLMAKNFIRMKLTGDFLAELTDLSGTSLMNVCTGNYDDQVLEIFGLEEFRGLLPPLIGSADLAGRISQKAASESGLQAGIPVAGGMFDIDACALASGIVDEKQMSLVVGTWRNNQYIAKEPLIDKDLFMSSIYCIPSWYLMLEGSPTSAGNLDWFIGTFLQHEKKREGKGFFEWLDRQVNATIPEQTEIIFLPFLYGCNLDRVIPASFYGMKESHTRAHLIRAVHEGIVFAHKTHINRLLNFRKAPEVIRCSGGAVQSTVWMQMFADSIGIPVEIPAGTQLGAAMAAAVCRGVYRNLEEAVANMSRIKKRYEPSGRLNAVYAGKFEEYKKLINHSI